MECGKILSFRSISFCILHSALCIYLTGCTMGGAISYKLFGPPAVEAKYVPAKQPMLVLVENYEKPSTEASGEQIARLLVEQMKLFEVAPTVNLEKLHALKVSMKPDEFSKMTIPAIGRACGAEQVLYVHLSESGIENVAGSQAVRAQMSARVKIVDAITGNTRWPQDLSSGYPVAVETGWQRVNTENEIQEIRRGACYTMADRIAKLFYKWKPDEFGEYGPE